LAKPIQDTIFKSRLTIKYRTTITGTVTQETLPYRLLVLGNFSGDLVRKDELLPDIEDRCVHSIKRELIPTAAIPDSLPALKSYVGGKINATLKGSVSKSDLDTDQQLSLRLKSGEGEFKSTIEDNGSCDITGRVLLGGTMNVNIAQRKVEPVDAKLKVVGSVKGALTDPVTGKVIGLITAQVSTQVDVAKDAIEIVPDESATTTPSSRALRITVKDVLAKAERTIPFASLAGFTPDSVASSIPEIRRLLIIKSLLLELQADFRNLADLRKAMKTVLPGLDDTADEAKVYLDRLAELKAWSSEQYPLLQIEKPSPAPQPQPPST